MPDHLVVPLHLKGIYVDRPMATVGPTADFSYLPWNDGRQDRNPDYAPLGEHVTTTPLDSANGELQPGIHLHWTLPHGLSSSIKKKDGSKVLPYVPVKWNIVPVSKVGTANLPAATLWSSALLPEDTPINQANAVVPVPYRPGHPAYRYMGRTNDLGDTPPTPEVGESDVEYFSDDSYRGKPLDCLGYGSLHFAPFYPNCREVFGHYQPLEGDEDLSSATYFVSAKLYQAGDSSLPINKLIHDTGLELTDILEQMEWPLSATGNLPTEITLAGAVKIDLTLSAEAALQSNPGSIAFSLGNTGTEALSALLANELAGTHGNRDKIEEQLEAILMHDKISGRSADLGLQFLEQRHKQGFRKFSGGTQWSLHVKQRKTIEDILSKQKNEEAIYLGGALSELDKALVELNRAQQIFDKHHEKLESQRVALFQDWYKYMLTKYPAPESLDVFDSAPYPLTEAVGAWAQHRAHQLLAIYGDLEQKRTAIGTCLEKVNEQIENVKGRAADPVIAPHLPTDAIEVDLLNSPAKPYFVATDPVVLIEGLDIPEPSLKQAELGPQNYIDPILLDAGTIVERERKLFEQLYPDESLIPSESSWNPFILEWEAEYLPALDSYGKNAPKNIFILNENQPEAQLKEHKGYRKSNASVLRGRTFLSPGAKVRKMAVLADFLKRKLPGGESVTEERLPELIDDYLTDSASESDENNAVLTAARAYVKLAEMTVLSQALGGFNEGLLQLENYEQPPLGDPLGTEQEQNFSATIGQLVGKSAKYGPNPNNPFSPVRAGSFRLVGLRIIDTWGRYRDLLKEQDFVPVIAQTLRALPAQPTKPTWAALPLRLSQALRLHFNWLAVSNQFSPPDITDGELPGLSPIVGWLGTNHLDQSLQFFTGRGSAIGYFNREAESFLQPPGDPYIYFPILPASVLQIRERMEGRPEYLHNFLVATNDALAQIAPSESSLHPSISILTGRPIAIARVQVRFELKGIPAQEHSWEILQEQIKSLRRGQTAPDTHWEKMKFPVRLGNYMKLNDGLVGFWQEDSQGNFQGPLHTMAAETNGAGILPHSAESTLWIPLDGSPVNLTVLFDPRGSIHATTGALPVQSIDLQIEHYTNTLNRISTWFLNAPLVQPASSHGKLLASPPAESGYKWSWVEKQADQPWQEITTFNATSERATLQDKAELREGWLKLR